MKTIGYAVVGTGYFGAELGRIMKEEEGAKIVAVLDPENAQSVAEELGCDVETDLDTLYSREDVDAVIIATPNYLHKEPVIKAAEHGVNVFCEKPIALSYQDCDEMVRACQEHGVVFMAGHKHHTVLLAGSYHLVAILVGKGNWFFTENIYPMFSRFDYWFFM